MNKQNRKLTLEEIEIIQEGEEKLSKYSVYELKMSHQMKIGCYLKKREREKPSCLSCLLLCNRLSSLGRCPFVI